MEQKTIFEQLGGTYSQQGDYLLPNLKIPEQPEYNIAYGGAGVRWTPLPQAEAPIEPTGEKRRRRYLKKHRPILYTNLLTSCKLSEHLAEIDEECNERMESLVKDMAKQEGVTEALKAADQMAWVRRMNIIRNRAEEIVLNEIVYV